MSTQTTQRTDDTKAWMANRNREVGARGRDAEAAGYAAFGVAARTGAPFTAPRSSDVITIGAQQLAAPRPTPRDDFDEFRRQQAEFTKMQHEEQRKNAWFAVPALAPVAAVMGLEGLGWGAARALGRMPWQNRKSGPWDLPAPPKPPPRRGGDTISAQIGRAMHADLKALVDSKPGWESNPKVLGKEGNKLYPDVRTPGNRYLEYKPDTPSGRAAGERQAGVYRAATERPVRVIRYKPKPPP